MPLWMAVLVLSYLGIGLALFLLMTVGEDAEMRRREFYWRVGRSAYAQTFLWTWQACCCIFWPVTTCLYLLSASEETE